MQLVKADAPVTPTMVAFKDRTVRGKLFAILPWVVFGAACVLVVVGMIAHYADGLDDDMASELVLAKMLSEGKGFILTSQWFYSTEIRFLNTQLVFTPLFWLFKSWAVVRIVGTIILNAIMLLSFYFLTASLQRKHLFPWLATLLLLPMSYRQVMLINFGAYYIPHIAIAFAVLGLLFYALRAASKKRNWLIAGAAGLSLLAAIGGFRTVMLLNLPLLMAAIIYWLINLTTEHKSTALKFLACSSIALGVALVGLLVNVAILQNCFSFTNWGANIQWRSWSLWGIQDALVAILATFGWHDSVAVFSVMTLGNVVAVMLVVLLIIAAVDIIKHREHYPVGIVLLTLFTLGGLAVIMGLCLTTDMGMDMRFTLPITVFVLPIIAFYLIQHWQWQIVSKKLTLYLKPILGAVALVLVLMNGVLISSQFYFANAYPWHDVSRNAAMQTIGGYLLAEGYMQGYYLGHEECEAGAAVLTEFSDGKIEVWRLMHGAGTLDDINPWLQPTAHATEYPAGKFFLLFANEKLTEPLPQKIVADANSAKRNFYTDKNFTVYVYDSVEEVQALIGGTGQNRTGA